jgi:hypothetical protein
MDPVLAIRNLEKVQELIHLVIFNFISSFGRSVGSLSFLPSDDVAPITKVLKS